MPALRGDPRAADEPLGPTAWPEPASSAISSSIELGATLPRGHPDRRERQHRRLPPQLAAHAGLGRRQALLLRWAAVRRPRPRSGRLGAPAAPRALPPRPADLLVDVRPIQPVPKQAVTATIREDTLDGILDNQTAADRATHDRRARLHRDDRPRLRLPRPTVRAHDSRPRSPALYRHGPTPVVETYALTSQ